MILYRLQLRRTCVIKLNDSVVLCKDKNLRLVPTIVFAYQCCKHVDYITYTSAYVCIT